MTRIGWVATVLLLGVAPRAAALPRVQVSADKNGFVLQPGGAPFIPLGFNYDRDDSGRLIEEYWDSDWPKVERDFMEMKNLGANVVRVHLQLARFVRSDEQPEVSSLEQLGRLVRLCDRLGLYLDLTGLGCYKAAEVPAWYRDLPEPQRWDVQARFWEAVAREVRSSPAVFCLDLMNEPVVSGTPRPQGAWLGPSFGGESFVQFINLSADGRTRPAIARAWIHRMVTAIRKVDRRHLITVGLLDWNSEQPGALSGFLPEVVAPELDFLSVHIYPESGKVEQAIRAVDEIHVHRPVLVEELFPLRCSTAELEQFIEGTRGSAAGWIGFYWGKPPDDLRASTDPGDAVTLSWLELFQREAKALHEPR